MYFFRKYNKIPLNSRNGLRSVINKHVCRDIIQISAVQIVYETLGKTFVGIYPNHQIRNFVFFNFVIYAFNYIGIISCKRCNFYIRCGAYVLCLMQKFFSILFRGFVFFFTYNV